MVRTLPAYPTGNVRFVRYSSYECNYFRESPVTDRGFLKGEGVYESTHDGLQPAR